MKVQQIKGGDHGDVSYRLLDAANQPIEAVSDFMRHLQARGFSPNTQAAYAYDLLHFMSFLEQHQLSYLDFTPSHALDLLAYLRALPSRSFYEYLILSGKLTGRENPLQKTDDPVTARVPARHRPFMGTASRQRPIRRVVRVQTISRVPRPMSEEQITALLGSLRSHRDKAMTWLMLQGGLRPGEILNLHLEDIQYGRRRVVVRYRDDHPKGVRTKSRRERVVDLYEPEALQALSTYVMHERPQDGESSLVFLVGGKGRRRLEPLSYHALVKLFERHTARLGIREPWVTPHALRHTHATRLWEGGMRELALQKRLGHASPESTRIYTQVSDPMMVAEYRRALGQEEQI